MTCRLFIFFLLVTTGVAMSPGMAVSAQKGYPPALSPLILADAGIPWNTLSPEEQDILKKHRRNWTGYPENEQYRLRDGARRYMRLTPKERDRLERKQKQYREMSPAERKQLRDRYHRQKEHH
jgi:hypothetical protein